MKKLPLPLVIIAAPIIVFVFAYIAYVTLPRFMNPGIAETVSGGIMLSGIGTVYKFLKDTEIKLSFLSPHRGNTVSEKLAVKWQVMLVYGTLMLFGMIEIVGGLEGLLAGYFLGREQLILLTIVVLNSFLIWPMFAFVLGGWIGRKCNRFGAIILPIIIIIAYIANILSTFMLPDSLIEASLGQTRQELFAALFTPDFLLIFAIPSIIVQILSGFLGFWRGYRTRSSDRLLDLMGVLPSDTQSTFVDLMYEEAQKVLAAPR